MRHIGITNAIACEGHSIILFKNPHTNGYNIIGIASNYVIVKLNININYGNTK